MKNKEPIEVSIIVPFYNSELFIKKCLTSIIRQDFDLIFEVILINDGSNDESLKIIKEFEFGKIQVHTLDKNYGPAKARNFGLKKAKGKYIFFVDADDSIESGTISAMHKVAIQTNADLVFCDSKWIVNNINQREDLFSFEKNVAILKKDLPKLMENRIYDPLYKSGILSFKGKLIRTSLIKENNVIFEENLKYLEDEIFIWNILPFIKSALYIRKQLYNYYVNPSISTAVSNGLNQGFQVANFKIIRHHIEKSFFNLKYNKEDIDRIGKQAFIYFIINVLISHSKSILLRKIEKIEGEKNQIKLIKEILGEKEVQIALKSYTRSNNESFFIPLFLRFKLPLLLQIACKLRAKKIVKFRKTKLYS